MNKAKRQLLVYKWKIKQIIIKCMQENMLKGLQ